MTQSYPLLIPIKNADQSKTRLSGVLEPHQRIQLVYTLVDHISTVVSAVSGIVDPYVVTDDQSVVNRLNEPFTIIPEPDRATNLGEVVDQSLEDVTGGTGTGVLVLPLDLPFLTPDSIRELVNTGENHSVVLTPDREQSGTNALWRSPANIITCQYSGTRSFEAHCDVAREKDIEPRILELKNVAFDLDTPEDWYELTKSLDRTSSVLAKFVKRTSSQTHQRSAR